MKTIGRSLGIQVVDVEGLEWQGRPEDFARYYSAVKRVGADAVIIPNVAWFTSNLHGIASEAAKSRMPTIGFDRRFVEAGGLMSYGPNELQRWPRMASQVDKILRGAKPGDLPVEQPTKFELLINLKAAKELGLTIPQSLVWRADEVIE
jgi:putative ABC transport system substrate-binding protein